MHAIRGICKYNRSLELSTKAAFHSVSTFPTMTLFVEHTRVDLSITSISKESKNDCFNSSCLGQFQPFSQHGSGTVYQAFDKDKRKYFAITRANPGHEDPLESEAMLLKELKQFRHPAVIGYEGFKRGLDGEQEAEVALLMTELCSYKSVRDYFRSLEETETVPSEILVWKIFGQILDALKFLHHGAGPNSSSTVRGWKAIAHGNVCWETVWLDEHMDVKLAGFSDYLFVPAASRAVHEDIDWTEAYPPCEQQREVLLYSDIRGAGSILEDILARSSQDSFSDMLKFHAEFCRRDQLPVCTPVSHRNQGRKQESLRVRQVYNSCPTALRASMLFKKQWNVLIQWASADYTTEDFEEQFDTLVKETKFAENATDYSIMVNDKHLALCRPYEEML